MVLNAFETWRNEDINILGFNNIKNNKLNAHRAKITIEVTSGIDWFNAQLKIGFGHKSHSETGKQSHSEQE